MCSKGQSGFTLVEMVMAIAVLAVGLAGLLAAFNTAVMNSANPMVRKQILLVAEEMMAEVMLKPYAPSGTPPSNSAVSCGAAGAARLAFDDVRDYANYKTNGVCDLNGLAVAGLESYQIEVGVQSETWQGIPNALRVSVTVSYGSESVSLVSWRTEYAK